MRGRPRGLDAAALIDSHIHNHSALFHLAHHGAGDDLGSGGAGDEYRTHDQVGFVGGVGQVVAV